jgi:hypothetical protein
VLRVVHSLVLRSRKARALAVNYKDGCRRRLLIQHERSLDSSCRASAQTRTTLDRVVLRQSEARCRHVLIMEAHELGLLRGDADGTRTHHLLRDRHAQIRFVVVRGRLQASVLSGSEEGCIFCRRP